MATSDPTIDANMSRIICITSSLHSPNSMGNCTGRQKAPPLFLTQPKQNIKTGDDPDPAYSCSPRPPGSDMRPGKQIEQPITRPPRFLNGGYWPSWKHYEGVSPSSIPIEYITHVNYAFASIDGDGTVYLADEKLHFETEIDEANGALRAWTQRKNQSPHLRVILAVGGDGKETADCFTDVACNVNKRSRFVKSVRRLLDIFDLNGVDIDWEYPMGCDQAKGYLQLLKDLRKELAEDKWVTTALPAGQWALNELNLGEVAKVVNFINLMAYDFVGPRFANVRFTGHHAQLHSTIPSTNQDDLSGASAVRYLLEQGVPCHKIVLGAPTYGHMFKGANALGQSFDRPQSGSRTTFEVCDLPPLVMTEVLDEVAGAVYATSEDDFVTYDNKATIAVKAEYVKQENLGGLFYWHLAGDKSGEESLIKAGHEVLNA